MRNEILYALYIILLLSCTHSVFLVQAFGTTLDVYCVDWAHSLSLWLNFTLEKIHWVLNEPPNNQPNPFRWHSWRAYSIGIAPDVDHITIAHIDDCYEFVWLQFSRVRICCTFKTDFIAAHTPQNALYYLAIGATRVLLFRCLGRRRHIPTNYTDKMLNVHQWRAQLWQFIYPLKLLVQSTHSISYNIYSIFIADNVSFIFFFLVNSFNYSTVELILRMRAFSLEISNDKIILALNFSIYATITLIQRITNLTHRHIGRAIGYVY